MLGEWMEREIMEQPQILRHGVTTYGSKLHSAIGDKEFSMVLLAARGSSDNAALFARYLIEVFLGIPVSLAAPSILTRYGTSVKYANCLAVGISQSGAAPDVAEILAALRSEGHTTLAITNTSNSRLTHEAEHSLAIEAGPERSVAATKTYTASLLAVYELVRVLGGKLADPSGSLPTDDWVECARESAKEASGAVVRNNPTFSLGRGFGFSTACETALKLMECALIPCKAYSSADFEHGPKALAGHGCAVVSFDGEMPELATQGCDIVVSPRGLSSDDSVAAEALSQLWNVIYGQYLALICARARGLDPDAPRYIHKVTETL